MAPESLWQGFLPLGIMPFSTTRHWTEAMVSKCIIPAFLLNAKGQDS